MKSPEQIGTDVLAMLAQQAKRNRADGEHRRQAIQALLEEQPNLTSQQIKERLPFQLSVRTVQLHVASLRGQQAAACKAC